VCLDNGDLRANFPNVITQVWSSKFILSGSRFNAKYTLWRANGL